MPLGKKEIMRLIKEEEDYLIYLEKRKNEILNGKYKNKDEERQKIESCSNGISTIIHQSKLELLYQILKDYYSPKPKKPSKYELFTELLSLSERRIKKHNNKNKGYSEKIYNLKYYTIPELKETLDKMNKIKELREEIANA